MPSTDAAISDALCIDSCIPSGMRLAVLISIFARIAGVSTDTKSLIDDATCINACVPPGIQTAVLISLAQQIVAAGGGSSSGSCLSRSVGPPATPSTCELAINVDDVGGWWWWDNVSAQWIAFA